MIKNQSKIVKIGKTIFTVIAAVVVSVGLLMLIFALGNIPGDTKPILRVADKFKPGSQWQLKDENVRSPVLMCISGPCPSVSRTWEVNDVVGTKELQAMLDQTEWRFPITGDCEESLQTASNYSALCSAEGKDGDFTVRLSVNPPIGGADGRRVILSVRPFKA